MTIRIPYNNGKKLKIYKEKKKKGEEMRRLQSTSDYQNSI